MQIEATAQETRARVCVCFCSPKGVLSDARLRRMNLGGWELRTMQDVKIEMSK